MENRAPYHTEAPKAPRNLTPHVADWLRAQGFTATEYHGATVMAHWTGSRGEYFQFHYDWMAGAIPDATCRLRVRHPGQTLYEVLFTAQKVRRLQDARLLLLGNVCYHNARLLAKLPHPAL